MYQVSWDRDTGGICLSDAKGTPAESEVRPVFYEELDLLGFDQYWHYPKAEAPLLWARGREYWYRGECVGSTSGGGFFEKPNLVDIQEGLELVPVDVDEMLVRNAPLMEGLVYRSIEFIKHQFEEHRIAVDVVAVAFSGGKDSIVILDLAQRALSPDEFVVVFNDTTMELRATYEAVERAKLRWPQLRFHTARSHIPAPESWRLFGPPSRFHRWCCSVHKSAPTLLLLRELVGTPSVRALVFEGVRANESNRRSKYPAVSKGGKHSTQTNARPVLEWSSAEIGLYQLQRQLNLHQGYRYGLSRVGCSVCPYGSTWSESVIGAVWRDDVRPLLDSLRDYADSDRSETGIVQFIQDGGWKRRAGGRVMKSAALKVLDKQTDDTLQFTLVNPQENWLEWAKTVGQVHQEGQNSGRIVNDQMAIRYTVGSRDNAVEIAIQGISKVDRFVISHLRALAYKTAYCVHCRACEVDCPTGALTIDGSVSIDASRCVHCAQCLSRIEKGCLAAKSLQVGKGSNSMKGIDRYCSFGLRQSWLEGYFQDTQNWWGSGKIGTKQFVGMRTWLSDAELIDGSQLTQVGEATKKLGAASLLSWAVIWINLASNSPLIRWYVTSVSFGKTYSKKDLIEMMGTDAAQRTRSNAATSLIQLFHYTPLGEELGLGCARESGREMSITKQGINNVPQLATLYALYRYAEQCERYGFSLRELETPNSHTPCGLFGMSRYILRRELQGISSQYPSWLKVEFMRDLDNVYLEKTHSSQEILTLA